MTQSLAARVAEAKRKMMGEKVINEDPPCDPITAGGSVKQLVKEAKKRGQKKNAPIATHKLLTMRMR